MHEAALLLLAATRMRRFTATSAVALAALLGLGYVTITWRRRRGLGGGQVQAERRHPERFELSRRAGKPTGTPTVPERDPGRGIAAGSPAVGSPAQASPAVGSPEVDRPTHAPPDDGPAEPTCGTGGRPG